MEIEILIFIGIISVIGIYSLLDERKKNHKKIEQLENIKKQQQEDIRFLKKESAEKDSTKVIFTLQDSIYNQDDLITYTKVSNFKRGFKEYNFEEYSLKKEYENGKLVNEEVFEIIDGKEKIEEFTNFSYEGNKETVVSFSTNDIAPTLKEKQEFIYYPDENIKKGYLEIYDHLDKTVKIDFYEKYDENKKLIESSQRSSIGFYETAKRINSYENNLLIKEELYAKSENNETLFSKTVTQTTKFIYNIKRELERKEIIKEKDKSKKIEFFTKAENKTEFEKAISKCSEYINLNKADLRYLQVISNLIFDGEVVCRFEANNEWIKITAEKITRHNNV